MKGKGLYLWCMSWPPISIYMTENYMIITDTENHVSSTKHTTIRWTHTQWTNETYKTFYKYIETCKDQSDTNPSSRHWSHYYCLIMYFIKKKNVVLLLINYILLLDIKTYYCVKCHGNTVDYYKSQVCRSKSSHVLSLVRLVMAAMQINDYIYPKWKQNTLKLIVEIIIWLE